MADFEQASSNITGKLQAEKSVWSSVPDYRTFDRQQSLEKIDHVYDAILAEGSGDPVDAQNAYMRTLNFINRSFDVYEGKTKQDVPIGRAFAVPMRITRGDEGYASESRPFVDVLDNRFGVNSDIRQRALVGLPPLVLDTYYQGSDSNRRGALVLTPLFADMQNDMVTSQGGVRRQVQRIKLSRLANRNINETARFAHEQLGADVIGLGAIIPSITKFGTTIKQEGLTTTTGHGGTVHLIVETAKKVIEEANIPENAKIGIIGGAGSIGYSTIDVVASAIPEMEIKTYDKNEEKLSKLVEGRLDSHKMTLASSVMDILRSTDVVITAVTVKIDLDIEDPQMELDLNGKFIIDDSQPGCFEREQVESRGGKLLWVVGEDGSYDKFLTRDAGYNFGDEAGIYGTSAVWGCEAEAGVISASGEYDKALRERVTPRHARSIGELCARYSVRIAPYQSFGRPVHL